MGGLYVTDEMRAEMTGLRTLREWRAYIQGLLGERDDAVEAALVYLYSLQTDPEKHSGTSKVRNGKGINAFDAPFVTRMARKVLSHERLSDEEMVRAAKTCGKYWRQLADSSKEFLERKKKESGQMVIPGLEV